MFVNDPRSPMFQGAYQEERPSRRQGMLDNKYVRESAGDFAWDFATKIAPNPKHFLKIAKDGALLGRPVNGLSTGYEYGIKGAGLFITPMAMFAAASAPRGRKVGRGLGTLAGGFLGATIGGFLGGPLGAFVGGAILSKPIEDITANTVDRLVSAGRRYNHANLGGEYLDTQQAWTMRQKAAQELNSSLLNARQHLGSEAMLMHG